MPANEILIGVVVDWKRGARHNGWDELLQELNRDNMFPNKQAVTTG